MALPFYSQSFNSVPTEQVRNYQISLENKAVEMRARATDWHWRDRTLSRYNRETDWLARDSGGRSRGR